MQSNETNNFLLLQESSASVTRATQDRYATNASVTPQDGMKIYISSINKLLDLSAVLEEKLCKYKSGAPHHKASETYVEAYETYSKMRLIVEEFRKHFSVTNCPEMANIISLLFRAFDYILERLDLYVVVIKAEYLQDVKKYLHNVLDLFKQMSDSIVRHNAEVNVDEASQEGGNALLNSLDKIAV